MRILGENNHTGQFIFHRFIMKIDFYTDTFTPEVNGVITEINTLIEGFRNTGNSVNIFAPNVPDYKDKDKSVFRISSLKVINQIEQRMALPWPNQDFRSSIKSNPDIIHAHTPGPLGALGLQLSKIRKKPYIFTYHTLLTEYTHYLFGGKVIKPWMAKRFSRYYCNLTDWVIAPSSKVERDLREWGVTKPISVVPNGVDLSKFTGDPGYLVKQGFVRKDDLVLLYVGRIAKEKNLEFLLKVFPKIKSLCPKAKLVIVGGGAYLDTLKKKAGSLKDSVVFTGLIPPEEVENAYAGGHIFLFSSSSEVHPFSIVEALASGLPIVALEDEALAEMVFPGRNGFLTKNANDFAKSVHQVVKNNLFEGFGKESKKIAWESFSSESTIKRHLEIYQQAIDTYHFEKLAAQNGNSRSLSLNSAYIKIKKFLQV